MNAFGIIFGVFVVAVVVVGSVFAASYFSSSGTVTDSYGNTVTAANNNTIGMATNVSATGTSVESGFLIFVAALVGVAFVWYFATKR